jgi:hypothetical protein
MRLGLGEGEAMFEVKDQDMVLKDRRKKAAASPTFISSGR